MVRRTGAISARGWGRGTDRTGARRRSFRRGYRRRRVFNAPHPVPLPAGGERVRGCKVMRRNAGGTPAIPTGVSRFRPGARQSGVLPSRSTRTSTFLRPFFFAPAMCCGTSSGFATAERPTATRRSPARSPWVAAGAVLRHLDDDDALRAVRAARIACADPGVSLASLRPSASTARRRFRLFRFGRRRRRPVRVERGDLELDLAAPCRRARSSA